MSLVREPILTAGFYWYDALPAQGPGFHQWLRDNVALVKVRRSVSFTEPPHTWAMFEVLFPALWLDAKQFGFPNTATKDTGPEVISSGAEPQKNPIDTIADSVKGAVPFLAPLSSGVLVLGGLLGVYLFFKKELFSYAARKRTRKH